jgi:predicted MFS family arabinose efflux permease
MMDRRPNRLIALRGCAALIIAMGIGRFAFTPLLPPMQADAQFSDASAGLLASLNLLGYLVGALLGGQISHGRREAAYRLNLVLAILADLLMAAPLGVPGWSVVRAIAGVSSGIIFVLSTAFVIEHRSPPALHFLGVGIGIVLSGAIAALVPNWQTAWLVLAAISLVLVLPAWGLAGATLRDGQPRLRTRLVWSWIFFWLTAAYGLEGFGYIISGTFLVAILHGLPEMTGLGPLAWIFVGVGAAAGPLGWGWLARRWGSWRALISACVVQAITIVLPFAGNAAATLVSAVVFGSTIIGITAVSLPLAARLRPAQAGQAVALLTIFYGIGQVIGPIFAGIAADIVKSFTLPILCAAVAVAVAGLLLHIAQRLDEDKNPESV